MESVESSGTRGAAASGKELCLLTQETKQNAGLIQASRQFDPGRPPEEGSWQSSPGFLLENPVDRVSTGGLNQ